MTRNKAKRKPAKPKKPPLGRRIGESLRSAGEIGVESVRNPRGIPQTAHGAFRNWFRKIWDTRGGSVYTLGYALTFAALELKTLVSELAGVTDPGDLILEQLVQFMIRFGSDSVANLVHAFMWPVFVVSWRPPVGITLFVLAFLLFPRYIKPHVERWLFRGKAPVTRPPADD